MAMTNADKVKRIIELIESGESERKACEAVGMSRSTFRTTALRQEMGDHYARALYGLAQDQIEQANQVIDDMKTGHLDPAIGRLELDWRKWVASKLLPKQYGDKVTQEHVGADGGALQIIVKQFKLEE